MIHIIKKVVVINGAPKSGKDTVCDMANEFVKCGNISTVDKIKKAYSILGWNGDKSEKHRKALSDFKDIATKTLDHSFNYVKQQILEFKCEKCPWQILFIHCREPEEIKRICDAFSAETLLVTNQNIEHIKSNHADAEVLNYKYNYEIHNDGSLEDLRAEVKLFLLEMFHE